ncbi:MAG: pilus assembly protein TadG-related protein, partial [Rhodanobacter sp.]
MLKVLSRFLGDGSGNFAIMTALLMPVVLVAAGAAVDFGLALSSSQRLTAAANGAVLAALSEVQARNDVDEEITEEDINALIRDFFLATSANIPFTSLKSATPVSSIDRNEIRA